METLKPNCDKLAVHATRGVCHIIRDREINFMPIIAHPSAFEVRKRRGCAEPPVKRGSQPLTPFSAIFWLQIPCLTSPYSDPPVFLDSTAFSPAAEPPI